MQASLIAIDRYEERKTFSAGKTIYGWQNIHEEHRKFSSLNDSPYAICGYTQSAEQLASYCENNHNT